MSTEPALYPGEGLVGPNNVLLLPSGQAVHLDVPARTEILESDIITGLGAYRYAGHLKVTIHVHLAICVGLARLRPDCTPLRAALCATHDVHEAYVGDLVYLWRRAVRDIEALERPWMARIHLALGLPMPRGLDYAGLEVEYQDAGEQSEADARFVREVDFRAVAIEALVWGHPHSRHFVEKHGGPLTQAEYDVGKGVWMLSGGDGSWHWYKTTKPAIVEAVGRDPFRSPHHGCTT